LHCHFGGVIHCFLLLLIAANEALPRRLTLN
jgi:hypothetical protein